MNITDMTEEFENFLTFTSCFTISEIPYEDRCVLINKLKDCQRISNLLNYLRILYCTIQIRDWPVEAVAACIMLVVVFALLILVGLAVGNHLGPALKILSIKLHMNEYLAGVTLLGFANASPDVLANLMPIRSDAPVYTITISNAVAVILLSGGTVCFMRPFKMNGHSTVRDLLFVLLGSETFTFLIMGDKKISVVESLALIATYIVYVLVNIVDLIIARITRNSLREKLLRLATQPPSKARNQQIKQLRASYSELDDDDTVTITDHNAHVFGTQPRSSWRDSGPRRSSEYFREKFSYGLGTQKPEPRPSTIDFNMTRTILHNENNPKNRFLFIEFFESIIPIDIEQWKYSGWCFRLFMILRAPAVFICTLFIPVVNYEMDKHGWSKLLNCSQIITNPILIITLISSLNAKLYTTWYMNFIFTHSRYSLVLTVPLAIFVFFQSRTDLPPPYHVLFIVLSACTSLILIAIFAAEIEILISIVAITFNLSENFIATTFRSISTAINDIIINLELAMQGYERMAYAAIFGAPLFNIMVGMGIFCYFNHEVQEKDSYYWIYGEHGGNCHIFLILTVLTTLWWTAMFNFFARRSAGLFSILLYCLFLIFATFVELEWVHELSEDLFIEPV
ncbi:mitochondrial sodium/calcium exchanger protein-like [Scaptodrosophila lebanonensis]|uniref:Mitochondrial sodium/calcium exchanger protein-like n=1 Tax=Drosophila lebanonensis TaxID=7225 RepID=A0A6J2UGM5_DROLE|nr:mitochondrial sodium/calcium exchanger protein-like [Scaptodrosophila lebanonensis]